MPLNESKGNMYPFVTHTFNTVKGKCPHDCSYCYMKKWGEQPELHFDESELKTDLGQGNFIFVGSSCDMWADSIPEKWIDETIGHCEQFQNDYLFQTKNPDRFVEYRSAFLHGSIFGITLETDYYTNFQCNALIPYDRAISLHTLWKTSTIKTMVTIEPIMDFDLKNFVWLISLCSPLWVNIGANTNHKVKLPEPEPEKIRELISALQDFTEVKIKKNLNRLLR